MAMLVITRWIPWILSSCSLEWSNSYSQHLTGPDQSQTSPIIPVGRPATPSMNAAQHPCRYGKLRPLGRGVAGFTRMKGQKNVLFIGNPIGNPIGGPRRFFNPHIGESCYRAIESTWTPPEFTSRVSPNTSFFFRSTAKWTCWNCSLSKLSHGHRPCFVEKFSTDKKKTRFFDRDSGHTDLPSRGIILYGYQW